jgi:hypothetical protein
MGNNVSLGYDEEDEQEHVEQEHVEQEHVEQEHVEQEHTDDKEDLNKNDNIKKSSIKNIKNKESANASVSESVSESIQAHESKIKKRKQTVRNSKASKKAGKTKSNKRILREYQSRYLNVEKEREQHHVAAAAGSTLLNSD